MGFIKSFGGSIAVTVVALILGYLYAGLPGLFLVAVLSILEVSLSFDNAVVNAKVVDRMSAFWQRLFLTVGVLIAVFGMRLVFPLVVVAFAAGLSPTEAVSLAMEKGDPETPGTYGYILHEAHPSIAAFGGMFLLMLFLNFLLDEREVLWLRWIERPFQAIGRIDSTAVVIALAVLLVSAAAFPEHALTVLTAGLAGLVTYIVIDALSSYFEASMEKSHTAVKATGKAAFFLFLYLEVLDASFSFDGVIGAFAITSDPIIIALGLGVGAMFVRSITIVLVRKGTLQEYMYLEHGAMWAVGALAVILLLSIGIEIPELVTGCIGVLFIAAGWLSSVIVSRRRATSDAPALESLTP
jgi:hypothetical protein